MGKVLVKRDEPHQCFARLELNNGDQVMISVAQGEVKVIKMKWAGMLPGPTLWKSENVAEIAEKFFDETKLPQRPIEAVIDKVIDCRSADEVVARLSAEPDHVLTAICGRSGEDRRQSHKGYLRTALSKGHDQIRPAALPEESEQGGPKSRRCVGGRLSLAIAFSASNGRGAGCGLPDGERASHPGRENRRRRPL